MSTITILRAQKTCALIRNYIAADVIAITCFNLAVEKNTVGRYMKDSNFRNLKVMEIELRRSQARCGRWLKILLVISTKYHTGEFDNSQFRELMESIDKNI